MPSHAPGATFRAATACCAMVMAAVGSYRVATVGVRVWAPKPGRDTHPRSPLWQASREKGHYSRRLLTRCLSSWLGGSVWGKQSQPSEDTSQPCRQLRMSGCFPGVCEPSTGGLRSWVNQRSGNRGHEGFVFSGLGRHRQKSKPWQPFLASVGCFSLESLKRCPSLQQAWLAIPWSCSSPPNWTVVRKCGDRFMVWVVLGPPQGLCPGLLHP